ncbi:hypothetical protein JL720_16326 [Aureococcus anophagefferens]|nr:hypothetical protein JL720_16326 [Aureococcus anophagefferens]
MVEGMHQLFVELDPVGCVKKVDYYLPCALEIVSKVASYGIIAGSAMLKLPQIAAILASRSAAGLSTLSFELDALVFVASVAYSSKLGYAFSTYGEQVIVLAQNACSWRRHAFSAASARGARPRASWRTGARATRASPGATVKLNALGAFVRFLTTALETADPVLLFGFGASTALNVALLVQLRAYRAKTAEVVAAGRGDAVADAVDDGAVAALRRAFVAADAGDEDEAGEDETDDSSDSDSSRTRARDASCRARLLWVACAARGRPSRPRRDAPLATAIARRAARAAAPDRAPYYGFLAALSAS